MEISEYLIFNICSKDWWPSFVLLPPAKSLCQVCGRQSGRLYVEKASLGVDGGFVERLFKPQTCLRRRINKAQS
jgi:hypothetical protein